MGSSVKFRIGAAQGRWHQYTEVGAVEERRKAPQLQPLALRSYGIGSKPASLTVAGPYG